MLRDRNNDRYVSSSKESYLLWKGAVREEHLLQAGWVKYVARRARTETNLGAIVRGGPQFAKGRLIETAKAFFQTGDELVA